MIVSCTMECPSCGGRSVVEYDFAILVSGGVQHVPCRGCGGEWTFALAVAFCPAKDKAEAQSQAADGASRHPTERG